MKTTDQLRKELRKELESSTYEKLSEKIGLAGKSTLHKFVHGKSLNGENLLKVYNYLN